MTSEGQDIIGSRHLARGLGTTLLARLGALIEIVAQPLYVAMFGLASFGLYAVLWALVNLLENIFDLGMTSALQRTVPQTRNDEEAIASLRAALLLGVGPCLIVAAGIWFAAPMVAPIINTAGKDVALVLPALQLFIWALPLWAFVEIATSALRARRVFGAEIRLRVFWEQLIRLVLASTFWAMGWGLSGLFVAHMISLGITALLCVRLLTRYYPMRTIFDGVWFGSMFRATTAAGLAVLPANMLARLFGDAPTLILNQLMPGAQGATLSALFTIGRKIASLVQLVRTAFAYVLAPLASSAFSNDREQVRTIYAYATRLIIAIVLPLALVLAGGVLPLLSLFGPEARAARVAVLLLLLGRASESVFGASVPVHQVIGANHRQLSASIAGFVIACLTGWWFVQFDALAGVAGGIAMGLTAAAAIPMLQLWHFEKLHPFGPGFAKLVGISAGCGLVGFVVALPLAALPSFLALALLVIITAAAIWCALRWGLSQEDRMSLGKAARGLRLV